MRKVIALKAIALFASICWSLVNVGFGECVLSQEDDVELERQMQSINKPAIKTITTEHGDIIDCIDIYKQPAFGHPLLKNHPIQRRPSVLPIMQRVNSSIPKQLSVLPKRKGCPLGSVPIRRMTKKDPKIEKCHEDTFAANFHLDTTDDPGHHFASIQIFTTETQNFFGARAYININNPKCEGNQQSLSAIWVESGPKGQHNLLEAGWMVSPTMYGDNLSHLYIYWSADGGHKTGCYNTRCPGFVQVDKDHHIGVAFEQYSTYGGDQYVIQLAITQDPKTKNWWLMVPDKNVAIGYWPKELVLLLANGAERTYFGGSTTHEQDKVAPQMGNGYFPDGSYYHSSYFKQVQFEDSAQKLSSPESASIIQDRTDCYKVQNLKWDGDEMGYAFLFGGPGGPCGN